MSIQEAIKKARVLGWVQKANTAITGDVMSIGRENDWKHFAHNLLLLGILDDPSFWQSLGKTMGWRPVRQMIYSGEYGSEISGIRETQGWLYEWHRFIDHLAEGKTAESFFDQLPTT